MPRQPQRASTPAYVAEVERKKNHSQHHAQMRARHQLSRLYEIGGQPVHGEIEAGVYRYRHDEYPPELSIESKVTVSREQSLNTPDSGPRASPHRREFWTAR